MTFADQPDSGADGLGDAGAGALRGGLQAAVAAAETQRRGELIGDPLDLLTRRGGAGGIVALLGLVDFHAQFLQGGAVGALGLLVEYRGGAITRRVRPHGV